MEWRFLDTKHKYCLSLKFVICVQYFFCYFALHPRSVLFNCLHCQSLTPTLVSQSVNQLYWLYFDIVHSFKSAIEMERKIVSQQCRSRTRSSKLFLGEQARNSAHFLCLYLALHVSFKDKLLFLSGDK